MCLVHKQPVNPQFLKRDHIVFRAVQQLFEFGLKPFLSALHGLNGKALAVRAFQLADTLGYLVNLVLQKPLLPLLGYGNFLKLAVPNDYSIIVAGGNPSTEFLPVGFLEVLLRGHKDIRRGVEPQKLACPLLGQMVRHNEHGFAAQSKALGLHRGSRHCKGLARTNLVREQGIAAIEDASNGVALVLAQGNFRVHTGERQVRAVVLSRFGAVEKLIVFGHQRLTAVSVFPQPVLEGVLNDLLLLLGEGRFFHI